MDIIKQAELFTKQCHYFRVGQTTTTLCCIEMLGGFVVVGKSSCIDPASFDEALGREYAYDNAIEQLVEHLVFARKSIESHLSHLVGEPIDENIVQKVSVALGVEFSTVKED